MTSPRLVVFGSLNLDLVARVPRLPLPGETLLGRSFAQVPGGKGANQAVAIARLGARCELVGRVGADPFGTLLLESLQADGVDTAGVGVDSTAGTGVALIAVGDQGENQIIVLAEANSQVGETDVGRLKSVLPGASLLLMQLEIPLEAVVEAARLAHSQGIPVILDPAPARDLPPELYPLVSILTPNEVEAGQLVGFPLSKVEQVVQAAEVLRQRGAATVLITLGDQGVYCATTEDTFWVPAFAVNAVDTVAAGDGFNGALAIALAEGRSLQESIIWGSAAGALAATCFGAQSSLPYRSAVEALVRQ